MHFLGALGIPSSLNFFVLVCVSMRQALKIKYDLFSVNINQLQFEPIFWGGYPISDTEDPENKNNK